MNWRRIGAIGLSMAMLAFGAAGAEEQTAAKKLVTTDKLVELATGINPQEYPCAREAIVNLYESRDEVGDLSRFHPKRLWVWAKETATFYFMRFMDFLQSLMNPDAVTRGIQRIEAMARGGNPLAGMDRKVEGWMDSLNPRNYVMTRKVHSLIENSTNEDGSCR